LSDVELTIDIQLKEANKKLDALGKKLDTAAVKGKKLGDANDKAGKKSAKAFEKANKELKAMAAGFLSVAAAQKFYQNVATSAKAMDTLAIFKAAGGSIESLRIQTKGLISDATLAKNANLARTMGISVDEFAQLVNIANAAAKATGESSEFMLESIVKGTARSSKLLLDNLGILVSVGAANKAYAKEKKKDIATLTDYDKKQAFINATIKAGIPLIEQATKAGANNAEAFEQMSATADNVLLAFGSAFRDDIAATAETVGFLADELIRLLKGPQEDIGTTRMNQALDLRNAKQGALEAANFAAGTTGKSGPELAAILRRGLGKGGISRSLIPGVDNAAIDAQKIDMLTRSLSKLTTVQAKQKALFKPTAKKKKKGGGGGKARKFRLSTGQKFAESRQDAASDAYGRLQSIEFDAEEAQLRAQENKDLQAISDGFQAAEEAKAQAQAQAHAKLMEMKRLEAEADAAHAQGIKDALKERQEMERQAHAERQAQAMQAEAAASRAIGIGVELAQTATQMFLTGEEHALEQLAALGLARVGSEFVAKGSLFAAEGVGMAIMGNVPGGVALGALGAGMIGTGLAMGAGSMAITQSLGGGGGADSVASGAAANRGNGTQNIGSSSTTQIVVNYGVNGPHPDETARAVVSAMALANRRGIAPVSR